MDFVELIVRQGEKRESEDLHKEKDNDRLLALLKPLHLALRWWNSQSVPIPEENNT